MWLCASAGHEIVPYEQRERQVGEPVAVEMPELAPPMSKLRAAEPVRRDRHAGP